MSIRVKLVLMFMAVALIPVVFISALTFENYKNSLQSVRQTELRDLAAYKAAQIESYFSRLKADLEIAQEFYNIKHNLPVLNRLARRPADPEFVAAKRTLDGQLRKMQTVLSLYDILLTDPAGRIVYASNPGHFAKHFMQSFPGPAQKVFAKARRGISFSDIFSSQEELGKYSMLAVAPLSDFQDRFIGVIAFAVNMEPVYTLIQDVTGLGNTGETLISKRAGDQVEFLNPLRHDPNAALQRRVPLGTSSAFGAQEAALGKNGDGRFVDYRDELVIGTWRYIPLLQWGMVAKIDAKEAFAEVSNLRKLVLLILAIVLALSAVMALSIARSISEPIKRLVLRAKKIGTGDLDYNVRIDSQDEIGQLAASFDAMTRDLKKTMASRDELNAEIEERIQVEAELKRSNENLEQFAYVASHDLQEPLRMMGSYSSLLERRYKSQLDKDADEFIGYIVDGAKRMQGLINDLLAYSRVGRSGKQDTEVDCSEVLDKVLGSMTATIEENRAIVIRETLPKVYGQESNFIHLFQNLIGNAIKFHGAEPPRIQIGAKRQDDEWLFSVRDNGIGIDAQYQSRIFLIFQRLHGREEYPGTGIGLSICKKIVETAGGRIWVESELGKDRFFTLPFQTQEAENMDSGNRLEPIEILLVEDNPGDIRLTTEALKEEKLYNNLSVVTDGVEAVAYLRKEGKYAKATRPDLILLDLNLPRKDGREVLKEIKNDNDLRSIPVVVLTVSKSDEDIIKTYNLHANCYITKPVDLTQFMKVAKSIQEFWFTMVKLPPKY